MILLSWTSIPAAPANNGLTCMDRWWKVSLTSSERKGFSSVKCSEVGFRNTQLTVWSCGVLFSYENRYIFFNRMDNWEWVDSFRLVNRLFSYTCLILIHSGCEGLSNGVLENIYQIDGNLFNRVGHFSGFLFNYVQVEFPSSNQVRNSNLKMRVNRWFLFICCGFETGTE